MGALCIFLLIACYYDYRYRRIPNILVLLIFIVGLTWNFGEQGGKGLLFSFLATMLVIAFLCPLFKIKALGAGDVKLFGVCSGYLSDESILYFLFFSLLIAAIMSIVKIILNRKKAECRKLTIPLAGPVLLSILLHTGGVY